jgi:uncharacterized membrane protein YoaK (UPF0700 family)
MGATPAGARPDHEPIGVPAADSIRHALARALLTLTFSTGLVDAVSYLGLGRVFTANMTGNIVLLGFGLADSGGLPVVAPLVSLAAFLAGSAVGGVLAVRTGDRHAQHLARALGIEIGLILAAAIVTAARGSARRISAVLAMLCGGVAGALLLKISLVAPLLAAAALALLASLAYVPVARREA